jgi:carotenoid cleavage dioxygenase
VRHGLFASDKVEAYTAHPHRDPATGELHAICYDALRPFRVQHIVVDAKGEVTRVQPIPVKHGPMIHDCALTASSVVVLDLPITFSLPEMLRGYPFPYRWNPKHEARVGLLPRNGTADQIRWFDVDPCYVFHPCNAYDTPDGGAVMDVVVHERLFHRSHQGPEEGRMSFERWTLDPATRRVQRRVLSDERQEFPRHDERLTGSPYRYAYTAAFDLAPEAKPLFRYDLQTGTRLTHHFGPDRVTGEAVFVPRAADAAEDDGWLITYVYDLREQRSDLVILNAGDFDGEPQAVVHLPGRVPMGFHGNWIPD